MVDCGVPFKDIQDHLYDVKYLLITHSHSDPCEGNDTEPDQEDVSKDYDYREL